MTDQEGDLQQEDYKEDNDELSLLRELCTVNGVSYDKLLHGAGVKVNTLEIFFFGCPRIVGLHHFPNLCILRIVNQKMSTMRGIECCESLVELWICETDMEVIEGLEYMSNLTHLYLYSNNISSITGVNHLAKLEKLWLNGNKIKTIEGISNLVNLKDINVADNLITSIGDNLSHINELLTLNLSGNPISSLEELYNVYQLTTIKHLSLCDPMYLPCPVCRLCNYSSLILYHMPELITLDGRDVDSKDLQELIKNLVAKKKQYYRLKIHNLQQKLQEDKIGINKNLEEHTLKTYSRLRILHIHSKFLSQTETKENKMLQKINLVNKRIACLENGLSAESDKCKRDVTIIEERENRMRRRWTNELASGGNTRYIDGKEDQGWYKSCYDLVNSRFIATDFIQHGISGIKVTMVTRIEDRTLHYSFADIVKKLYEAKDPQPKKLKDLFSYLFVVRTGNDDPLDINYSGCGPNNPIILTNNIGLAENERLKKKENNEIGTSHLILCKVYIAEIKEHDNDNRPHLSDCISPGGVYVTISSGHKNGNSNNSNNSSHQRLYYIFDHRLVLPEYCISIRYDCEEKKKNTLEEDNEMDDNELITMNPQPENKPKLSMLDTDTLLTLSQEDSLDHIQELDLTCNSLTRFRFSNSLSLLSFLNLSFNELETTEDFCNMPNLQTLDISFNKITSLQGMKSLPKLTVLDVSWNLLHDHHSDVAIIKKHIHNIQSLDIRHNNNTKCNEVDIVYILGMLRTLQYLNGKLISEEETTAAIRQVVAAHLSLSSLVQHCRIDSTPPPSLSLSSIAQQVINNSNHRPVQLHSTTNTKWTSQVTAVDLSSLNLKRLTCLDQLINLKWACLNNNQLTNIEGIESCSKLEELTLDNNRLIDPPTLDNYQNLQWLSIADNSLNSLPMLPSDHNLSSLVYLNISGNNISSLQGIEHYPHVQELYASRNPIVNLRQLFALKPLSRLLIADFSHTPLSLISTYRVFVTFHLTFLKCLDAKTINNSEIALAKEKLGGRLTQDNVYEKFPNLSFPSIVTLDFPNYGLKQIDLSPVRNFDNLMSLNLEHNSLTSFSGIVHLKRLKVLCLNHNRIECLMKQVGGADMDSTPILPCLQVLHLAYNGICQLQPLQLCRLIGLRALFLQGNEISRVDGLNGLYSLTELVLDRNKIKMISEHSLVDLGQLRELHIEENRLSDLSNINLLQKLERLFLGMNRIQEYSDLEKLAGLNNLLEFSIISNPISRRMQHRSLLIYNLPALQSLDGVGVSIEERQMAEMTFSDRQDDVDQQVLPTLSNTSNGQVKVMSIPFQGNANRAKRQHSHAIEMRNIHMQTLQSFQDKRHGRR